MRWSNCCGIRDFSKRGYSGLHTQGTTVTDRKAPNGVPHTRCKSIGSSPNAPQALLVHRAEDATAAVRLPSNQSLTVPTLCGPHILSHTLCVPPPIQCTHNNFAGRIDPRYAPSITSMTVQFASLRYSMTGVLVVNAVSKVALMFLSPGCDG